MHNGATLDIGGTFTNSGTLAASGGSLTLSAITSNAGLIEGTTSQGLVIDGARHQLKDDRGGWHGRDRYDCDDDHRHERGLILASGAGAQVELNNPTILGGKLQTSGSNAVIETVDGSTNNVLIGGTIASGSKIRCFRSAFGAQN